MLNFCLLKIFAIVLEPSLCTKINCMLFLFTLVTEEPCNPHQVRGGVCSLHTGCRACRSLEITTLGLLSQDACTSVCYV